MIHCSGNNDVLRTYATAQHDGVDYNLAYSRRDFTVKHETNFDIAYMRALLGCGYREAPHG